MGLFGGDSTSVQKTTNRVDSSTLNANQAGALLGIAGRNNSVGSVNVLDAGAIKSSIGLAGTSVAAVGAADKNALGFASTTLDKTLSLVSDSTQKLKDSVNQSMGFAERAGNNAMRIAFESAQPGVATMASDRKMIEIGLISILLLGGYAVMRATK